MGDDGIRQVQDVSSLKALAHPLRVRLLASLRGDGPATATELAKRLDTESGSTSYHLRVLAEHGFVADAKVETPRHPRERRWTAVDQFTEWSNTAFATTPAGREASGLMRRRQVEILMEDVSRFEESLSTLDPAWIEAAGIGDLVVSLTPESVTQLWDRFYGHLDQLVAHDAATPTATRVSVVVAAFPRPEKP
jgi:DNA-binding transcriptional ArsR family regulator